MVLTAHSVLTSHDNPARRQVADTWVSLAGWRKGVLFVNGVNVGRYWDKGPQQRLYLPATLLTPGANELVVFEQEALRPLSARGGGGEAMAVRSLNFSTTAGWK